MSYVKLYAVLKSKGFKTNGIDVIPNENGTYDVFTKDSLFDCPFVLVLTGDCKVLSVIYNG